MSFVKGSVVQKFLDGLQHDFKTLAQETKKKYPHIKEVSIIYEVSIYLLIVCECIDILLKMSYKLCFNRKS